LSHISFSALKNWNQCPYYYKLTYVDRVKKFLGNQYTAFGTALHSACENKVLNESLNEQEHFTQAFLQELQNLPEDVRLGIPEKDIENMHVSGKELATLAIPGLKSMFGDDFEVVSTEEQLYSDIQGAIEKDTDYKFKGFIDLVVKTSDGKYHIIDWKSCSWGWDARRRSEPMTTYQLTYYKYFFAKKHDIPMENIETYFGLLKRTAKTDRVEIFRVTSGPKKVKNSLTLLNKAIANIQSGRFIKNRLSCSKCEFYNTEECPGR